MEPTSAAIRLVEGDVTEQQVDAIVNAANSGLLGGGGVDGAVHRRGGPAILEGCKHLRRTKYPDGLPTGEAASTEAGNLPARYVIHAVGPVWSPQRNEAPTLLRAAYRNALDEAQRLGVQTVAFPSISTGAYRYPIQEAAEIAISTVREYLAEHPHTFTEVRFVLFSADDLSVYREALQRLSS